MLLQAAECIGILLKEGYRIVWGLWREQMVSWSMFQVGEILELFLGKFAMFG